MAHSDRHLFVHLPHSRRAHGAIRAAEVPALHFRRYLGGCSARVRGGKGCDKSNTKGQFKTRWHGNADFSPGREKHSSSPLFPLTAVPLKASAQYLSLYIHVIYPLFALMGMVEGVF